MRTRLTGDCKINGGRARIEACEVTTDSEADRQSSSSLVGYRDGFGLHSVRVGTSANKSTPTARLDSPLRQLLSTSPYRV